MQAWFEQQETLQYKLGLEFDQSLEEQNPHMAASKPDQHGGYCTICYSELTDANSKSLPCGHTFCTECW